MTVKAENFSEAIENDVEIERIIDAPPELVFRSWTAPERVMRWWGPKGFTSPSCKIDLRVGGKYLYCMRDPEGKDYWSKGVYRQVEAPNKLIMTDSFSDQDGQTVPATYYGMNADWPTEMLISLAFEEYKGRTKLLLKHSGLGRVDDIERGKMVQGWTESLNKLDAFLAEEKKKEGLK